MLFSVVFSLILSFHCAKGYVRDSLHAYQSLYEKKVLDAFTSIHEIRLKILSNNIGSYGIFFTVLVFPLVTNDAAVKTEQFLDKPKTEMVFFCYHFYYLLDLLSQY